MFKWYLLKCRCEVERPDHGCSLFHSPTNYQLSITNKSQFIIEHLLSEVNSGSSKCDQFIVFGLCFYLYRSCELRNVSDPTSGSQLPICREKCAGFDKLYQECTNKEKLQIMVENSQIEALNNLVTVAERFMCSDPNTYIIPQVPVSNKSCDNVSYINHLLPREGLCTYTCIHV